MIGAEEYESLYRERVAAWYATTTQAEAVLLRDTRAPDAPRVLAGWWSRDDEPDAKLVLPNPWDERDVIPIMERRCWEVTESLLVRLAPVLDDLHSLRGGERYWRFVLAPWLYFLVTALADRCLFLSTAASLHPGHPVVGAAREQPPSTMSSAVERLRDPVGNAALMSSLALRFGLQLTDSHLEDATAPGKPGHGSRNELAMLALRSPRVAASLAADRGVAVVSRLITGRDRRRRVAVVGLSGLRGVDELALVRRVAGLRFPRGTPPLTMPSAIDPSMRGRLAVAGGGDDDLQAAVLTVLPGFMPVSVMEGFAAIRTASARGYGRECAVLVGNYSIDEPQNDFIGRCADAGHRIAFAQHGGSYGQLRVHGQERLEMTPGTEFWSWGKLNEPGVRPVVSPWLARLRNTHRGGDAVVLVEGLHPPERFVIRFSSTPLGNQAFEAPELLERFVLSAGKTRDKMRFKRFPAQLGSADRPPALAGLRHDGPPGARGASGWMQRARLAVVSYPDTPFIEAMVIGVPTVGLWNPGHYEWREDARDILAALAAVRVAFGDPVRAAQHVDAVYSDPSAWWDSPEVVAARNTFLERFARAGDWRADWSRGLTQLAGNQ